MQSSYKEKRNLHDRSLSEFILTEVGAGMTTKYTNKIVNY